MNGLYIIGPDQYQSVPWCYIGITALDSSGPDLVHNHAMNSVKPLLAFLVLATSIGTCIAQERPQMDLERIALSAGMHQIDTQLAVTPQQQQIGLMFRQQMPAHEGMLFVFPHASKQCFWMKNTLLPLTAAFVAEDGTIVNLADMKPKTTEPHCSLKPVRYVLEMNQGWFTKKGIKAGFKLGGKPFTP